MAEEVISRIDMPLGASVTEQRGKWIGRVKLPDGSRPGFTLGASCGPGKMSRARAEEKLAAWIERGLVEQLVAEQSAPARSEDVERMLRAPSQWERPPGGLSLGGYPDCALSTGHSCVYVIESGLLVKIGVSVDPRERLGRHKRLRPEGVVLLALFRGDADDEERAHFTFGSRWCHGEWFFKDETVLRWATLRAKETWGWWACAAAA